MPALDGLRALAVGAVMAYHLGVGWASGGYLGVDLFFVLSGFLITGLLVNEHGRTGSISLRAFWGRRARRLLPALLLVLLVLSAYATLGGSAFNQRVFRGDALAALAYVANWHFLAAHQSYFAQFSAPSPLEHTWSLAIEEQFYIVWPLVVLAVLTVAARWGRSSRTALLAVTGVIGVASVAAMAVASAASADPGHAYFGTDARAFELLVGAALALLVDRWIEARWLGAAGIGAATVLVAAWALVGSPPPWMFRGGFLAGAVLAAVVVADVSRPHPGRLGRALSAAPLRYVGRISYGLYLWHWPVFRLLGPGVSGLPGPLADLVLVTATFAAAAASYHVVERPVRGGLLSGWRVAVALPAAVTATTAAILVASLPAATAAAAAPPATTAGFSAAQTTAGGGQAAGPPALPRVPTASDPLRVLVIGDSVMDDTEPALAAMLESTGEVRVTNLAAPWWGLTQSKWSSQLPLAVSRYHPEVVIGTWGWDFGAAAADPTGYARTLDAAVGLLEAPGDGVDQVVLLQYPRMGPHPGFDAAKLATVESDRQRWNAIAAREATGRPSRVAYLPVAGALELDGRYSTWLQGPDGRWSRARMIDQLHPCPTGAARTAAAVVTPASRSWKLPAPAARWWTGAWVHDHRFDTPPGSCPDDQPPAGTVLASGP